MSVDTVVDDVKIADVVDVVDVVNVVSFPVVDGLPLTGIKLYNAFKKTLPKGLDKVIVAEKWNDYKITLGLPIVEKVKKEKKEKVVKIKVEKVKKDKKVKTAKVDILNNMIGDFDLGQPSVVECSA